LREGPDFMRGGDMRERGVPGSVNGDVEMELHESDTKGRVKSSQCQTVRGVGCH
jgi:hypothetical protein